MNQKDIILTGIRSNDTPTIGNYLGAMVPMVDLQRKFADTHQINMFVPDLHSFTTPIDHDNLFNNTLQNLKFFMAAGLDVDNEHTHIYRQSYVPAHSELTWILNCFTYFGELSRMIQFKEKSEQHENVSVGLFDYPVLMAADILLYGARWIPVGEDQRQHLELARDIAIRMNNKFGDLFVAPEPWEKQLHFSKRDDGIRIRSLSNPEKKMSKSVSDPKGTILLTDKPKEASKKVMSATTDSFGEIKFDLKERPGVSNLLQMLAIFENKPQSEINDVWEGQTSYGDLKKAVAQEVEQFLADFQARMDGINTAKLEQKLEASEAEMRKNTAALLLKVQQAVGVRPK